MPSHPSADEMRDYLAETAKLAADIPADSPEHERLHQNMNDVIDQIGREGA
ncbi:hypothetical protein [Streptomyces iconiensis]|uniref:Uncharacterized protein n=1 Tax=Streptomyces iconiensis TaxID=1384038 RepID=A0ABT7AB42_9ACTN|nr:hypothetical protein [Streptomyces iconiensis]MDJ1138531.1 hypothetical protein [Streptomyces iconiensis]